MLQLFWDYKNPVFPYAQNVQKLVVNNKGGDIHGSDIWI